MSMWCLHLYSGARPRPTLPERVHLGHCQWPIVIGRDADIQLDSEKYANSVSRRHAQLDMVNGRCCVTDLGSLNGTLVNNRRLAQGAQVTLQPGDVITFGKTDMQVSEVQYQLRWLDEKGGLAGSVRHFSDPPPPLPAAIESSGEGPRSHSLPGGLVPSQDSEIYYDASAGSQSWPPDPQPSRSSPLLNGSAMGSLSSWSLPAGRYGLLSQDSELTFSQSHELPADAKAPETTALLPEDLKCIICCDIFAAPHSVVPCGHMFCGACIALAYMQDNFFCPSCRCRIELTTMCFQLNNYIEDTYVSRMTPEDRTEWQVRNQQGLCLH